MIRHVPVTDLDIAIQLPRRLRSVSASISRSIGRDHMERKTPFPLPQRTPTCLDMCPRSRLHVKSITKRRLGMCR